MEDRPFPIDISLLMTDNSYDEFMPSFHLPFGDMDICPSSIYKFLRNAACKRYYHELGYDIFHLFYRHILQFYNTIYHVYIKNIRLYKCEIFISLKPCLITWLIILNCMQYFISLHGIQFFLGRVCVSFTINLMIISLIGNKSFFFISDFYPFNCFF